MCPPTAPQPPAAQQLSERLSLPPDQLPPLRIKWSHLTKGPQGELWGRCPKVPSDLEAKVGYHIDTKDPQHTERVFGYLHQKTTNIDVELGLELPVGTSTYPANVPEGSHFQAHRAKVAIPFRPQQVELADAGYDVVENYQGIRDREGIPIIAYHPRREDLSPEALLARGYDTHGTPYAPCGRLCRSNGYDYQSDSRQYCLRPAVSLAGTGAVSARPEGPGLYAPDVLQRVPTPDWPHTARDRSLADPLCGSHRQ